jgi:arginase
VRKIAEDHAYLVGARELDPGESGNLNRSKVHRIAFGRDEVDAPSLLAAVRRKPVWLHVDLDIVDPRELPAVALPVEGGPSLKALEEILTSVAQVADVRGIEICGYDTRKDPGAQLPGVLTEAFAGVFS